MSEAGMEYSILETIKDISDRVEGLEKNTDAEVDTGSGTVVVADPQGDPSVNVYVQSTEPTGLNASTNVGDLWYVDTADTVPDWWDGYEWMPGVAGKVIYGGGTGLDAMGPAVLERSLDTIDIHISASAPGSPDHGEMYRDTGGTIRRWDGSSWVTVTDANIINAVNVALDDPEAVTTDNLLRVFYRESAPGGLNSTTDRGDYWYDITDNAYIEYFWDGAGWTAPSGSVNSDTDGLPPSKSPAAIATGGVGSIFIQWDEIVNNDPVTYDVYLSTTTPVVTNSTTKVATVYEGTLAVIRRLPDDSPLVTGTTYHTTIFARDADGNAPGPGVEDSATPIQIGTTEIADDSISTPKLQSDVVTTDKLFSNAVTTAKLDALAVTTEKLAVRAVKASNIDVTTITADRLSISARSATTLVNGNMEDPYIELDGTIDNNRFGGWYLADSEGVGGTLQPITVFHMSGSRTMRLTLADATSGQRVATEQEYPVAEGQRWLASVKFRLSRTVDVSAIAGANIFELVVHTSNGQEPPLNAPSANVTWHDVAGAETASSGIIYELSGVVEIPAGHVQMGMSLYAGQSQDGGGYYVDIDEGKLDISQGAFTIINQDTGDTAASIGPSGDAVFSTLSVSGEANFSAGQLMVEGSAVDEYLHTQELEVDGDITVSGETLANRLIQNYRTRFSAGQHSDVNSTYTTSAVIAVITVDNMKADHVYELTYNFTHRCDGTNSYMKAKIYHESVASGTPTTPTLASSNMAVSTLKFQSSPGANRNLGWSKTYPFSPGSDGNYKFALALERLTGTSTSIIDWSGEDRPSMVLKDLGPVSGSGTVIAQKAKVSGSDDADVASTAETNDPTVQVETFSATWSSGYAGGGSKLENGTNHRQGYYDGSNGNMKSAIGFDHAAIQSFLSGITTDDIIQVELFMYFSKWYNKQGTAIIGRHSSGADQNTWGDILAAGSSAIDVVRSSSWPENNGRWVDITSMNKIGWQSGTNKGILLGPGPTTTKAYHGTIRGQQQVYKPVLRFTISKVR